MKGGGEGAGKRKGKEFHGEEEWGNAQNAAHTMCLRIMPRAFLAFLEERKTTRDQMKISSFILFASSEKNYILAKSSRKQYV